MTDIAGVLALYDRWGTERYDEEVAQLDHALQTAAHAKLAAGKIVGARVDDLPSYESLLRSLACSAS
jgi:hypothetical protein